MVQQKCTLEASVTIKLSCQLSQSSILEEMYSKTHNYDMLVTSGWTLQILTQSYSEALVFQRICEHKLQPHQYHSIRVFLSSQGIEGMKGKNRTILFHVLGLALLECHDQDGIKNFAVLEPASLLFFRYARNLLAHFLFIFPLSRWKRNGWFENFFYDFSLNTYIRKLHAFRLSRPRHSHRTTHLLNKIRNSVQLPTQWKLETENPYQTHLTYVTRTATEVRPAATSGGPAPWLGQIGVGHTNGRREAGKRKRARTDDPFTSLAASIPSFPRPGLDVRAGLPPRTRERERGGAGTEVERRRESSIDSLRAVLSFHLLSLRAVSSFHLPDMGKRKIG
jgi:hypothetical protein